MAVAQLKADGWQGNASGGTLSYFIRDAATIIDALAAIVATAPSSINGYNRGSPDIQALESVDDRLWEATVPYARRTEEEKRNSDEEPRAELSFNVSTETLKVVKSLDTVSIDRRTGLPAPNPTFGGLVGVSSDGVSGADILVGSLAFNIRTYPLTSTVNIALAKNIYALTGKVCSTDFLTFTEGEVLYLGATADVRDGDKRTALTHSFLASPSLSDIEAPDFPPIAKKGFEYVWTYYREALDDAQIVKQTPDYIIVEKLYRSADFSLLGINPTGLV
jgi:hypothetical protein